MPMTVQPVDGLISRLIQQNSRAGIRAGADVEADRPTGAMGGEDRVVISAKAARAGSLPAPEAQGGDAAMQPQREGARSLEARLLRLYRENEASGDRA
ncbi:MAG: hypothetical protein R8K47_00075 [Mariprofundaceae bacterium]